jgi:hypothetical protein
MPAPCRWTNRSPLRCPGESEALPAWLEERAYGCAGRVLTVVASAPGEELAVINAQPGEELIYDPRADRVSKGRAWRSSRTKSRSLKRTAAGNAA